MKRKESSGGRSTSPGGEGARSLAGPPALSFRFDEPHGCAHHLSLKMQSGVWLCGVCVEKWHCCWSGSCKKYQYWQQLRNCIDDDDDKAAAPLAPSDEAAAPTMYALRRSRRTAGEKSKNCGPQLNFVSLHVVVIAIFLADCSCL